MEISWLQSETMRENDRHKTLYLPQTGVVEKVALSDNARSSLDREWRYANSFNLWEDDPHVRMPSMIPLRDVREQIYALQMPYYPWEVMKELKEMLYKWNRLGAQHLFDEIIYLTSTLRTKHNEAEENLRKDTFNRMVKYSIPLIQYGVKNKVQALINNWDPKIWFREIVRALQVAWSTFLHFDQFTEEYQIHGCLHLEHIRRDIENKLVPIDFEHWANFPRRLKYQDEAYIFQNILQNITDKDVAKQFLEAWLWSIWYEKNPTEQSHAHIALCEKLLGGIFELLTTKSENYEEGVKKHMEWLLLFWERWQFLEA